MAVDKGLLEILVCPVTKVPVRVLARDKLKLLNEAIEGSEIVHVDGTRVTGALREALITRDNKTVYKVTDGIPVMLEGEGILTAQLADW